MPPIFNHQINKSHMISGGILFSKRSPVGSPVEHVGNSVSHELERVIVHLLFINTASSGFLLLQIKRLWVDMHPDSVNYNRASNFEQSPHFNQNLFFIAMGWITGSINPRTCRKTHSNYPAKWPSVCFCPWGARLIWHQTRIAFKQNQKNSQFLAAN